MDDFKEYMSRDRLRTPRGPHKIGKCFGVVDYYNYYRTQVNKKYKVDKPTYLLILGKVIDEFTGILCNGDEVNLPYGLGKIIPQYNTSEIYIGKDSKLKNIGRVDWVSTYKLWYQDKEARENKILIRHTNKKRTLFRWEKRHSRFANRSFYTFSFSRAIRRELYKRFTEGEIKLQHC